MDFLNDILQLKIKKYTIPTNIIIDLRKEAIKRANLNNKNKFRRKDFKSNNKSPRWLFDFYGLHGEYAVEQFLKDNNINYIIGKKFETDYTQITHDFIVNNINIGVKTVIIKKYKSINDFFRYKKYGKTLFYPYRGTGTQLKGHSYPDFLFFCIYMPNLYKNIVYILGYVSYQIIINSKIVLIYNKKTHLINLYNIKNCDSILPYLKN